MQEFVFVLVSWGISASAAGASPLLMGHAIDPDNLTSISSLCNPEETRTHFPGTSTKRIKGYGGKKDWIFLCTTT